MSSSRDIAQQYKDGGVIPADLVGEDGATKTYVNNQLAQRDAQIAAAASAASGAQTDINLHKADNTVHVLPSEKAAYNGHIADGTIHLTPDDKNNWNGKAPGTVQTDLTNHTSNVNIHTTSTEKTKLADIQHNAEVNQNAFSAVNDVPAGAKTDTLFIVGGIGITVSTDPTTKKVTITATGSATPGPHASTHITGGADRIPDAVTSGDSGLMSGSDAQFVRVDGETKIGAQAKVDALAGVGNTKTVKQLDDDVTAHKADETYQVATGTATALIVPMATLVNGYSKTFIASANNGAAATTINSKRLYKPSTVIAPTLIAGKAYTVWYNLASDCFFIKASAEGTATVAQVLAGVPFSNEIDTGLIGAMPNNGVINQTITTQGGQINLSGYVAPGSNVTASITNLVPQNIVENINVGGVVGTAKGAVPNLLPLYTYGAENVDMVVDFTENNGASYFEATAIRLSPISTTGRGRASVITNSKIDVTGFKRILISAYATSNDGGTIRLIVGLSDSKLTNETGFVSGQFVEINNPNINTAAKEFSIPITASGLYYLKIISVNAVNASVQNISISNILLLK